MHSYLVQLLRAALHNTPPTNPPSDIDWRQLYTLANSHSVACTVYYGILLLPKEHQPEPELLALFRKASQIVLGRESMQHFELQYVMEKMDSQNIPYLPLKGWKLKHLYPRPDMRSMCDVDLLVMPEDMPKIPAIMEDSGFDLEQRGMHHDEYIKNSTLSVEIHKLLFEEFSPWHEYFKRYMDRTSPVSPEREERQLSHEDFYIYIIAHMAKHFRNGGTGVRSVMDVYEYQCAYADSMDAAYLDRELEKLGLRGFAHASEELAQAWFSREGDFRFDCRPKMAAHILTAGTYGHKSLSIESSVHENGSHKGRYLLRRFFPKRYFMEAQYPCIAKAPFLLPFFWIVRGFRIILFKRQNLKMELQTVRETDEEKNEYIEELWKDSGFRD